MPLRKKDIPVTVQVEKSRAGGLCITLGGRLDSRGVGAVWHKIGHTLKTGKFKQVTIDMSGIEFLDSAGAGLIAWIEDRQKKVSGKVSVKGLSDDFMETLKLLRTIEQGHVKAGGNPVSGSIGNVGKASIEIAHDLYEQVIFTGELMVSMMTVLLNPKKIRFKDVLITAESAGADAFGIIALVGFLLGLILAYQSVYTLKNFGAEIYVADIVSLSLFRELGPLMTAIILAGRSGSAFAAEIGTMKVNEEIDALTTMGLDPVGFLALPRVLAAVIVTPMLSLVSCFFGLIGAGLVMLMRGFTITTYCNQVRNAVDVGDLNGGLAKALVFAMLIASIGCLRGLQTKQGARSVGVSATRAVVSGIVLIVVADGIFAVIFNILGI